MIGEVRNEFQKALTALGEAVLRVPGQENDILAGGLFDLDEGNARHVLKTPADTGHQGDSHFRLDHAEDGEMVAAFQHDMRLKAGFPAALQKFMMKRVLRGETDKVLPFCFGQGNRAARQRILLNVSFCPGV